MSIAEGLEDTRIAVLYVLLRRTTIHSPSADHEVRQVDLIEEEDRPIPWMDL